MGEFDELIIELDNLAKLQIRLEERGGPTEDGELFEEVLGLQSDILEKFKLPVSPKYEAILCFDNIPTHYELNERINRLHSAATHYLLSDAKSDSQILTEAKVNHIPPAYVLPELNIASHVYTFFVYENILLKDRDSVENVLSELQFCSQNELLNLLGTIYANEYEQNQLAVDLLKSIGVKYIDQFLKER